MIDRRQLMQSSVLAGLVPMLGWRVANAVPTPESLRITSLKFGSLSWLIDTIKHQKLDAASNLQIDVIEVATNQAGPIALLSGEADVIVSDWTWAMRQRAKGEKVRFAPFSSALGAIMVPADGKVAKFEDLVGKKLGVAGSSIDKSWLLLRGYSRKKLGKDIADVATPTFGTPPLLSEELRSRRLDGVLNFWTYAARLSSEGYVQLLRMDSVLAELGISPVPAMVGFVWREETGKTKAKALSAFFDAVAKGNDVLIKSDEAWQRLKPLVKPASDVELQSIAEFYRSGVPKAWGPAETQSAETLMKLLVEVGDQELVGHGTKFDAELFYVAG